MTVLNCKDAFGVRDDMRRREFITLLSGSAAIWPLAARAQERDRTQRIGVMFSSVEGDPQSVKDLAAFKSGLQALGWREGANLQIDYRCGGAATPAVPGRQRWSW